MIPTRSGYMYVDGIDGIAIDGGIMTRRADATSFRGEDIAFAYECAIRRESMVSVPSRHEFSRIPSGAQIDGMIQRTNAYIAKPFLFDDLLAYLDYHATNSPNVTSPMNVAAWDAKFAGGSPESAALIVPPREDDVPRASKIIEILSAIPRHRRVVISPESWSFSDYPTITIYDDISGRRKLRYERTYAPIQGYYTDTFYDGGTYGAPSARYSTTDAIAYDHYAYCVSFEGGTISGSFFRPDSETYREWTDGAGTWKRGDVGSWGRYARYIPSDRRAVTCRMPTYARYTTKTVTPIAYVELKSRYSAEPIGGQTSPWSSVPAGVDRSAETFYALVVGRPSQYSRMSATANVEVSLGGLLAAHSHRTAADPQRGGPYYGNYTDMYAACGTIYESEYVARLRNLYLIAELTDDVSVI